MSEAETEEQDIVESVKSELKYSRALHFYFVRLKCLLDGLNGFHKKPFLFSAQFGPNRFNVSERLITSGSLKIKT